MIVTAKQRAWLQGCQAPDTSVVYQNLGSPCSRVLDTQQIENLVRILLHVLSLQMATPFRGNIKNNWMSQHSQDHKVKGEPHKDDVCINKSCSPHWVLNDRVHRQHPDLQTTLCVLLLTILKILPKQSKLHKQNKLLTS